MDFKCQSNYQPKGDQPKAIEKLSKGIRSGFKFQTLLGVTGSGKTYTMSKTIERINKPTLVISPNKTLAAQLYEEFSGFFPENKVCYFVSYYDYYQPEAYIPQTDTYIEKDAKINEEIDRLRHEATQALLTRKDVLIVASVSAIYNLGSPKTYQKLSLQLSKNQEISRQELMSRLLDLQFERNDYELWRGRFRKRAQFIDLWLSGEDKIIRILLEKNKIKSLKQSKAPFGSFEEIKEIAIWPAKFWLTDKQKLNIALSNIALELQNQYQKLKNKNKLVEAERLKRRTEYDLSMIQETGWCAGIENYSRHLEFRKPGSAPYTLLDYFLYPPKFSEKKLRRTRDYLLFIDESHIAVPQIRGMYYGDQSRKETLVKYGFRLPSALDNRPLKFNEFLKRINQTVFVSATPQNYEKEKSEQIVEQIIRPTYLLDPIIEIRKTKNQVADLLKEIKKRKQKNQRVLVLTLTKRLAEALAKYIKENGIKANYLHSDTKTLLRPKVLASLRKGEYEAVVGINLLREGLDLPEVSLIAILDADKEGFLRDAASLIQIMGRASRHQEGKIIMYGDKITSSMKKAIEETERRRKIQRQFNKKHNLKPSPIKKEIKETLSSLQKEERRGKPRDEFVKEYLKKLKNQLDLAKRNLQYEKMAEIKEEIKKFEKAN